MVWILVYSKTPFNARDTYILIQVHNWPLQSFSQDYGLASSGTYVYINGGTPNNRYLRNFSWQFYLLSEFLPEIC